MTTLSIPQARKLALHCQGLPTTKKQGTAYCQTLNVFKQLGYVQIDTISVVQRAHHHTLWSRNPRYQPAHLDALVANKEVFEYWSHAAAYLPMSEYRYTLPRKQALKTGQQKHWYNKDQTLMDEILRRIDNEGPLMAKDFDSKRTHKQGWGSKPTKQALECLFMQGELMISERKNFHKVYQLTEKVLPDQLDTSQPTAEEYGQFLVMRYLRSHGFGNLAEMTYLLKHVKLLASNALNTLIEDNKVERINVAGSEFFACTQSLELLDKRLNRKQAKVLSPFDNLLIQRKRAQNIFNFEYLLECYVPEAKRQYGYFCLPILWEGTLVARADCKVDNKASCLNVMRLFVETSVKDRDAFMEALGKELENFANFNQCLSYAIESVSWK
ncbi:winged helix-turn-helix domain-containing protein [Vibrio sonorensis]|uniref:winged helix-turn-helix domain-containing protein n=1 Tax=Vibrio sonorensis TaxID=1004316 RepID=UPI0008DA3B52|nr:crosslink repair DNA glycosylase YcaQ family protein [Vibrio sonorensis]